MLNEKLGFGNARSWDAPPPPALSCLGDPVPGRPMCLYPQPDGRLRRKCDLSAGPQQGVPLAVVSNEKSAEFSEGDTVTLAS